MNSAVRMGVARLPPEIQRGSERGWVVPAGLIVELFSDFAADTAPSIRVGFDGFGIEDDFLNEKFFGSLDLRDLLRADRMKVGSLSVGVLIEASAADAFFLGINGEVKLQLCGVELLATLAKELP